jgi:hypothetical protein
MTDQRLERLEKEMSALSAGQQLMEDIIIKRMEEMGATLHNQYHNSNSGEGSSKNKGPKISFGHSEAGMVAARLAKLNFP